MSPSLRPVPILTRVFVLACMMGIVVSSAAAGDWHYGNGVRCSDCHTQHNSSGGAPMRIDGDPAPAQHLLLHATAELLCLSCHDGTNPQSPNVISDGSDNIDWAAGRFPRLAADRSTSTTSHKLNALTLVPYGTIQMSLTCTTCHDPHGNANYRNLRPDPTLTMLPPVTVAAAQTVLADGTNAPDVYVPGNIIYKEGVSAWCIQCHTDAVASGHVVGVTMFGSLTASYTAWLSVPVSWARVPSLSPSDNDVPSPDDEVMCLSCHKAHGSAHDKALLYADGATLDSTCQECHDQ